MRAAFLILFWLTTTVQAENPVANLQQQIDSTIKKVTPSVVSIWYGNPRGHVTGTVISVDGLIVTCGHMRREIGDEVEVCASGHKPVTGKVIGRHPSVDLALIQVSEKVNWPVVSISNSASLTLRDPLLAIGYPSTYLFESWKPDPILYVRLGCRYEDRLWANKDEIKTTVTSRPGDSGGPLFDIAGSLVGVLSNDDLDMKTRYVSSETLLRVWKDFAGSLPVPSVVTAKRVEYPGLEALTGQSVSKLRSSVAEVRSDDRWTGVAVYVGKSCFLAKASELGPRSRIVMADGLITDALVAARDPVTDLALLQVPNADLCKGLPVVTWAQERELPLGAILAAVTPSDFTPPCGVVCVTTRAVPPIKGILPVDVKNAEGGVVVTRMYDGMTTPWLRPPVFPLQVGDVITEIAGQPIRNVEEFKQHKLPKTKLMGTTPLIAGTMIDVTWIRNGKMTTTWVHLRLAESGIYQSKRPYSYRFSGYPKVLAADFVTRPEHCGAPVIDAQGRVVGLLIAKAPYIESLVLPVNEVKSAVERMMKAMEK